MAFMNYTDYWDRLELCKNMFCMLNLDLNMLYLIYRYFYVKFDLLSPTFHL